MLRIEPFLLRFKSPFRTSKGTLDSREGIVVHWVVEAEHNSLIGAEIDQAFHCVSECAPLIDFSKETLDDVKGWFGQNAKQANKWISLEVPEQFEAKLRQAQAPPSIRFALSCLWVERRAAQNSCTFAEALGRSAHPHVLVNGILPLDSPKVAGSLTGLGGIARIATPPSFPDPALTRIEGALQRGITCFKVKCDAGSSDLSDWLRGLDERLARLLEIHPEIRFKLDFNESLPLSQVGVLNSGFSDGVRGAIEYLEDPCPLKSIEDLRHLRAATTLPIALDEPLTAKGLLDAESVIESGLCDVVILKPMAIGSIFEVARIQELAERKHVDVVITTLLEGPVGVAHIRTIASIFGSPTRSHGLDTLGLFEDAAENSDANAAGGVDAGIAPDVDASDYDAPLIISGDSGFIYTYSDIHRFIDIRGLRDFSGTAVVMMDRPEQTALAIASLFVYGIPFIVPPPERWKNPLSQDQTAQTETVTGADQLMDFLKQAVGDVTVLSGEGDGLEKPVTCHSMVTATDHKNLLAHIQSRSPDSIVAYVQTSGSTGNPKWIAIRLEQVLSATRAMPDVFRPASGTVWLNPLPLHHIGGIMGVLRNVLLGASIRIEASDTLARAFADSTYPVHGTSLVATQLTRLLDKPGFALPERCQAILLGGGPVPETLFNRVRSLQLPVYSGYGMTETCAMIAVQDLRTASDPAVVGHLFSPNVWRLAARDGEHRDVGDEGDFGDLDAASVDGVDGGAIVDGDGGVDGVPLYLRGPQISREVILEIDGLPVRKSLTDAEGWFDSGDISAVSELEATADSDSAGDTYQPLRIIARRTDLILSGGKNIRPEEVEHALATLPFIRESAVIGIPDPEWGQIAVACIVLKGPLSSEDTVTFTHIKHLLENRLPGYKIPKKWLVMDTLPRTTLGKLKRSELREMVLKNVEA